WLVQDYFRARPRFDRALSLCCGDASHELGLYQSRKVRFVRGFDISEGAIRQANARFLEAGVPQTSFLFEVRDANRLDLDDSFDLVLSTGALHHVTALEDLLDGVRTMLRPDGRFVLLEFVGPNRFQWTPLQCELINGALAQLDPCYLRDQARQTLGAPP